MGLPIMPLNDRNKVVLEDTQIGFIRFVALGLFESISEILPGKSFLSAFFRTCLTSNDG